MKKLALFAALTIAAVQSSLAWGPGCHPCHPCHPWRPGPHPAHCHGGGWGRGGCNFWPGFVGGLIGGAVAGSVVQPASTVVVQQPTTVVTQPVVVQQPTVVQQTAVVQQPATVQAVSTAQNVWVEGRYVDAVQANGTVIRTWQPGHYEQRTVVTQ